MKKILTILFFTLAVASVSNAQRRSTVSGVVADADTRRTLTGALIAISPETDSTSVRHIVSGAGGVFSTGLDRKPHNIAVSMLGYETLHRRIEVVTARTALDTLYVRQGIHIDAVAKEAVAMRTSVEGDTLIYNADAYKVAADANISGLLEKMPGIKVDGAAVEAQGEAVKKVLIDGREYFGEDVGAAISSLPAEVVKSIEVFDKLSDNAEFTGIDDGEGYKAINIRTRESMRQGVMGQVSALYGVEPPDKNDDGWHHYGLVGGNVNIFQGDAKITIGGTLNNLNERHFTSEDILGAGDNDGIAKVGRFQANYIDTWGKKDQWKIDASYTYGITDTDNHTTTDREYFDNGDYSRFYSVRDRNRVNQNHSLGARIDFKPNQYHELRIRPEFRYQGNRSYREGTGIYYPLDENADPVSLLNWERERETGWMARLNANYRVRLGKPGRTLSLFFNGSYDPDDENDESYAEMLSSAPIRKRTPAFDYNYHLMGGMTYTEPITDHSLINLDYSIRYNYEDIDQKSYLWHGDNETGGYLPDYNTDYSGEYNSGYLTHRVGPGYRGQWGKTTFSVGGFYEYSTLESSRVLPLPMNLKADFHNFTYASMLNAQFTSGTSIRLFLRSMTRNPSVGDLQDVVDPESAPNFSKGNPLLKPSYNHMMFFRLIVPNVEKGRTFAFNMSANYSANSIARSTISNSSGFPILNSEGVQLVDGGGQPLKLDAIGRYSVPVNMDGAWSTRAGVDYGFPLTFMKSNLNLNGNVMYGESPSQMGKWNGGAVDNVTWTTNYSRNLSTGGGLTLGSNISERVDFRLSYGISYNNVRNTFSDRSNSEYMRHILSGNAKFVLPKGFTLAANFMYFDYAALTGLDLSRRYFIANAAVGKKVFRSQRGEVSLFINDIFNQNVDYRPEATAEYFQRVANSAVGRYFGVKFTWNIRKFGKNGSQNIDMYQTPQDDHRHGSPGGPPPGGGYRGGGFGGGHRH